MRHALLLLLLALPMSSLAKGVHVCDPPPSNSIGEPTCSAGSELVFYPGTRLLQTSIGQDLCTQQDPNEPRPTPSDFIPVCVSTDNAPPAYSVCDENPDNSVSCHAWPVSDNLEYNWSTGGALLLDPDHPADTSAASFLCSEAGLATVSLSVTNAEGYSTVSVTELTCDGGFTLEDSSPPTEGEGLPYEPEPLPAES